MPTNEHKGDNSLHDKNKGTGVLRFVGNGIGYVRSKIGRSCLRFTSSKSFWRKAFIHLFSIFLPIISK